MFNKSLTTYTLVKNGPDVNPRDVEIPNTTAVEIVILWGDTVLHVAHLLPPKGFVVGESSCKETACDFFVPEEVLGVARMALVVENCPVPTIVVPAGATGSLELPGEAHMPIQQAAQRGVASFALAGGRELQLPVGARAQFQLGDFTFQMAAVAAGRPCQKGFAAGFESEVFSFFGLSLAAVGGIVAAAAFLVPTQNGIDDEPFNSDQVYVIQQYLRASAEREAETQQTEETASTANDTHEGGTGTRAKNEEGAMGTPTVKNRNGRYGIAGPRDNADVHVSKEAALQEARNWGVIGMLNAGLAGDPKAPTAPWGRDEALGRDDVSARGNMWGDDINDSFGMNGLGLTGIGQGGGGLGEGIGLGNINTIGNGAGTGPGQGFGAGGGNLHQRGHKTKTFQMRIGQTIVTGRLPPEVIQRIVRQNYGRFRLCYEQGLGRNPNLQGRVQVRFVIGRDGAVSNVQKGDSDLPDSAVVGCVLNAYYGLSFPQPDGGIVTVAYPIMFQPG